MVELAAGRFSKSSMQVFIINLQSAPKRWSSVQESFASTPWRVHRVSAVDGDELRFPIAGYAAQRFHWLHGRGTNPREVGCYLSHIKALQAFLQTDDSHALICEDDVLPKPDLAEVLQCALRFSTSWNILRLTGLSRGIPLPAHNLCKEYRLCVGLGRMKGAGAYVIDRAAARSFVAHLLPMWLPYDHALDREWFYGLRGSCVLPFPCSQVAHRFPSSIQKGATEPGPGWHRWLATYPYQVFNEATRWFFRGASYLRVQQSIPEVVTTANSNDADRELSKARGGA